MITEVLLILPLYLILFFIWWRFRHLIKIMADVGDTLSDNEFFGDVVDTPNEGIEQHRKRECLKGVISMGKTHLLGHKWTYERVDKASHETINKTYALYKQRDMNKKGKKLERPWASMSLTYTLLEFLGGLKSRVLTNYTKTLRMI